MHLGGAEGGLEAATGIGRRIPAIIHESCVAMEAVVPGKHAHCYRRGGEGYVEVWIYWKHWPCLIPQHGPGRKHLRRIALVPWQQLIVDRERKAFIRGRIHSDGCPRGCK
jgi:hypothetical protein